MCLIVVAVEMDPDVPLVALANRDEFHRRPTEAADFWEDAPSVLAGRDLEHGGTWFGVDRRGRWAAVTNYREPGRHRVDARSRGDLVAGYLRGAADPADWLREVALRGDDSNGFSLLAGRREETWYVSNRDAAAPRRLTPGVHGLSNHLLDTPWPKVERLRARLHEALAGESQLKPRHLLRLLDDREPPPDADLPATGLDRERERLLAAPLVVSPEYGTRSSTVLMIHRDGRLVFSERQLDPSGRTTGVREFDFRVAEPAG
jgi:uncharacterized protein with NRDE domain